MHKASEGVKVRFIYDDFGSRSLRKDFVKELRAGGVEASPFYEVRWPFCQPSQLPQPPQNHRDRWPRRVCRNMLAASDRYINTRTEHEMYWRDTHVRIEGPAVWSLQYPFLADWNFCTRQRLNPDERLFPPADGWMASARELVQIVAGGPDFPRSGIMLSFFTAIAGASERIYLTSPYFIPNTSILDALRKAALSGKDVRVLVPGFSDSAFVNAASRSYYRNCSNAGLKFIFIKKALCIPKHWWWTIA